MAVTTAQPTRESAANIAKRTFIILGILPFILLFGFVFFGSIEPRFLSAENIFNVTRQSTYLAIVAMGQMLALLTGNFDLSVGSNAALTSVVTVSVILGSLGSNPDDLVLALSLGIAAGLATGLVIGLINGIGVAFLKVNSFIMTLGMLSMAFGVALTVTGGLPIYGLPKAFSKVFAYGTILELPVPVIFTGVLFVILYFVLTWTRLGRYFYAVGSNERAARLSGINTKLIILTAMMLCGLIAAIGGVLLAARTGVGEAGLGESLPLQAITACVIGGVSLFGGIGRIGFVILGAFFITLLTNGMNLIQISSYVQIIVVGAMLIVAVIADRVRLRYVAEMGGGK